MNTCACPHTECDLSLAPSIKPASACLLNTFNDSVNALPQVLSAEAAAEAARKQAALRTLSVRSVREAMEKARDGDVIVFEDGPHNVGGDAVVVDKRVLIRCGVTCCDCVLSSI